MSEKTQMQELKPCPFCGGKPSVQADGGCHNYVLCDGCFAESPAGAVAEAIAAWNTRTPQPTDAASTEAHAKLDALIDHRIVHPEPCFPPDGWHPENVSGCPTCEWSMRDEGLTDELDTASEVAAAAIAAAREEG
jgi:Lar family restriction alleviation protein